MRKKEKRDRKMKIKQEIEKYRPWNEQEEVDQQIILRYLKEYSDIFYRENPIAHFSASSWIVNEEKTKVLMLFHNIYQTWSWSGGHADGEEDLLKVAIKEAKEETGIYSIKPLTDDIYSMEILCVNGHQKKGKYVASHVHLNITYLLEAKEGEPLRIKPDENSAVKWVKLEEAIEICEEIFMKEIYDKLNQKLKKYK